VILATLSGRRSLAAQRRLLLPPGASPKRSFPRGLQRSSIMSILHQRLLVATAVPCVGALLLIWHAHDSSIHPHVDASTQAPRTSETETAQPPAPRVRGYDPPTPVTQAFTPIALPSNGAATANPEPILTRLTRALAAHDAQNADEALDDILSTNDGAALSTLERVELHRNEDLAPKIISSIGRLGKTALPRERGHAVDTLSRWLEAERKLDTPEARGNRIALVRALGALNTDASSRALASALDDARTPLHVQTLIVEQLAESSLASAAESVRHFQERLSRARANDTFEAALVQEATIAANTALQKSR
jgi:hypothetical protein